MSSSSSSHQQKMGSSFPSIKRHIPGVARILLVASGKGGVGKSTIATFTRSRLSVGLLDADIYGPSIPTLTDTEHSIPELTERKYFVPIKTKNFGHVLSMQHLINQSQGLNQRKPFAWRGLMLTKALQQLLWGVQWTDIDLLIIDMPPGTGDPYLTVGQQVIVDGSLLVTTPSKVTKGPVMRSAALMDILSIKILGVVENMSWWACPACKTKSEGSIKHQQTQEEEGGNIPIIGKIPLDSEMLNGSMQSESTQALFDQLANLLINKLGEAARN